MRKEDQDKINRFSRIHSRHKLLEEELKAKQVMPISHTLNFAVLILTTSAEKQGRPRRNLHRARTGRRRRQSAVRNYNLLFNNDTLGLTKRRYKIGDSFFSLPVPEVQELLSSSVVKIDEQVTALEEKMSGLNDEMSELKAALYGRFGRSINLET